MGEEGSRSCQIWASVLFEWPPFITTWHYRKFWQLMIINLTKDLLSLVNYRIVMGYSLHLMPKWKILLLQLYLVRNCMATVYVYIYWQGSWLHSCILLVIHLDAEKKIEKLEECCKKVPKNVTGDGKKFIKWNWNGPPFANSCPN